jgi:hypothetical protein
MPYSSNTNTAPDSLQILSLKMPRSSTMTRRKNTTTSLKTHHKTYLLHTKSEQDDKELEVQAVDQHTSQDPSLAHSAENEQNDEGNEHHNITQHTPRASSVTQDDGSDKHEGGKESLGIGSQSAIAIKSQS